MMQLSDACVDAAIRELIGREPMVGDADEAERPELRAKIRRMLEAMAQQIRNELEGGPAIEAAWCARPMIRSAVPIQHIEIAKMIKAATATVFE